MDQVKHDRPQWLDMRRQDIDASEPLTLFDASDAAPTAMTPRPPDACGTPDMFGGQP